MGKKKPGVLRIGTSNVVLPFNKTNFPEAFRDTSRLTYYASLFNTVELNSTFYKVPMAATFKKWSSEVPADFLFSIKLWREITHAKNLVFEAERVASFLEAAAQMTPSCGCLLVQFPGKISLDYYAEVENCLQLIAQSASGWRAAVEFRNRNWYTRETYELLDEYGASMVLHDQSKAVNFELRTRADFVYIRLHGPNGDYRGAYEDAFLSQQTLRIKIWLKEGRDVFVYFNNTMGNAFDNAVTLQKMNK